MMIEQSPRNRLVMLAATFSAVYGVLRLIPFSLWIGGSGRAFTATEFVSPLLGILLGPYVGSVAAVFGTFLAILLTGRMNFLGLDFLPVLVNALVLGLLMKGRWWLSFLIYSLLLVLFFLHPLTLHFVSFPGLRVEVPFVWLHLIAWAILLSPLSRRSVQLVSERTAWKATPAACILTMVGTTAQHLTGTLLYASLAVPVMGIRPEALSAIWQAIFYIYPFERLIVIVAGTIVTAAAVRALMGTSLVGKPVRTASRQIPMSWQDAAFHCGSRSGSENRDRKT